MNYNETVAYLYSANLFGSKLGLQREHRLLFLLGNPQTKLKCILVGGTNGKGSTAAMISAILREAGFRVGRFTKPHLIHFTERFNLDGRDIGRKELAATASEVREAIDRERKKNTWKAIGEPTFFEIVVAIALLYFAKNKADFAVLEVGLGGRLDATNVCDATVSIITNVGLEHTGILGNSIAEIAAEKGGIIKKQGILVTSTKSEALAVLRRICRERASKLVKAKAGYPTALLGSYQLTNAGCAAQTARELSAYGIRIGERTIRAGLRKVKWPGRLEIVRKNPVVVLDCAKDAEAMKALRKNVVQIFRPRRMVLMLSISSDKDFRSMVKEIIPIADVTIVTKHSTRSRALDTRILAAEAIKYSKGTIVIADLGKAIKKAEALAGKEGLVLITGSVFTVGEARSILLHKNKPDSILNESPAPSA